MKSSSPSRICSLRYNLFDLTDGMPSLDLTDVRLDPGPARLMAGVLKIGFTAALWHTVTKSDSPKKTTSTRPAAISVQP